MNKFSKFGLMLGAFVLAFGLMATAQAATLGASINAPAEGANVTVGQAVSLNGTATGGTGTYPSFRWAFSDGSASIVGANQSVTFNATGTKVITLTVTDSNGDTAVASRNVTVVDNASKKPVISNIHAINITQTSVTITWDTDIVATSRVIYDTTSHADITGQTGPNFGYAISTAEADVETKVKNHSVTITGLSPATKYYFRVISQG